MEILQSNDNGSVHFINAIYQGYLSRNGYPDGEGIIIDDEFNVLVSKWRDGLPNGHTIIHLKHHDMLIYGEWKNGSMKGIHVILYEQVMLYLQCIEGQWCSQLIAHSLLDDIVYVIHIDQNQSMKYPEIKVTDRRTQYNIKLIAQMLSMDIKDYYLSPLAYMDFIVELYSNFQLRQQSDRLHYFGNKNEENNLGFIFNYDMKMKSIGLFNPKMQLNGMGICDNKNLHTLVGIFKQGILSKEFNYNQSNLKQYLRIQNMKSINYQHTIIYLPILSTIYNKVHKINQFIKTFQQLFRKHNNKNDDSLNQSSQHTIFTNKYQVQINTPLQNIPLTNLIQTQTLKKQPGFILKKSPLKNPSKSPPENKSPSFSPPKTFKKSRKRKIDWKI